jgi:hypothetical protein
VRRLVDEHLSRRRDHGNRIWLLLSAEVWYRRYIGGRSTLDLEAEIKERRPPRDGPHPVSQGLAERAVATEPATARHEPAV